MKALLGWASKHICAHACWREGGWSAHQGELFSRQLFVAPALGYAVDAAHIWSAVSLSWSHTPFIRLLMRWLDDHVVATSCRLQAIVFTDLKPVLGSPADSRKKLGWNPLKSMQLLAEKAKHSSIKLCTNPTITKVTPWLARNRNVSWSVPRRAKLLDPQPKVSPSFW
jgi:hypothetical protein